MAKTSKPSPAKALADPYTTLVVDIRDTVALVALARPDVHNAFDETSIDELTDALEELARDDDVRAVILLGHGKSFCAGADLNWMRRMAGYSNAQNLADAKALANERKHGVSFLEARTVFSDPLALHQYDGPHSWNEERFIIIGTSESRRVLFVVYVERIEETFRLISARTATTRERRAYEEKAIR